MMDTASQSIGSLPNFRLEVTWHLSLLSAERGPVGPHAPLQRVHVEHLNADKGVRTQYLKVARTQHLCPVYFMKLDRVFVCSANNGYN